jgi:hypothetical protein
MVHRKTLYRRTDLVCVRMNSGSAHRMKCRAIAWKVIGMALGTIMLSLDRMESIKIYSRIAHVREKSYRAEIT